MNRSIRILASTALVASAAAGLTACGGDDSSSSSSGSGGGGKAASSVKVLSSLPLQGASKDQLAALVNGIKLALSESGGKAGDVKIDYESLDDSTAQAGKWDPTQTGANARKAVSDKSVVAYIGEFNSGASQISMPVLNGAGIAQISPANTAVGLTTSEPGSESGEPAKYAPTGKKTYMRIVPRDTIQASAVLSTLKADGCQKTAVANDQETYGAGLAKVMGLSAGKAGVTITSNTGIQPDAANFRAYAAKIKGEGANCFVFSGVTANGAAQIYKDVAAAIPGVKLYGPDGVCESGLTNPSKGGLPKSLASQFHCTVATLDLKSYPGGDAFLKSYTAAYKDAAPDPYAIYGYEAMKLVVDTIGKLPADQVNRAGVLKALLATKDRQSALGTYSFDKNGDTTLTDYGLYEVGPDGNPKFEKTLKAAAAR
jgi:branched-chain amino acid transport system substrate-binding protein